MPNILIIEDNSNLRESLRLALEGPYYNVRCARDAEQGLLYVLNWEPDVVITDYMLPGMNGMEFIDTVGNGRDRSLQINRKPRIILISARMDAELEQSAKTAGADGCLGKPFDLNRLTMMITELTKNY
ncbi:response regulator [bacterium]|nr:response regulator [bacterium]